MNQVKCAADAAREFYKQGFLRRDVVLLIGKGRSEPGDVPGLQQQNDVDIGRQARLAVDARRHRSGDAVGKSETLERFEKRR